MLINSQQRIHRMKQQRVMKLIIQIVHDINEQQFVVGSECLTKGEKKISDQFRRSKSPRKQMPSEILDAIKYRLFLFSMH